MCCYLYLYRICSIIMSSSISEIQIQLKVCEKYCNSNKVLQTSCTKENLNRKFWKCKGCGAFEWHDDRKSRESNDFGMMEDWNLIHINKTNLKIIIYINKITKKIHYNLIKLIHILCKLPLFKLPSTNQHNLTTKPTDDRNFEHKLQ